MVIDDHEVVPVALRAMAERTTDIAVTGDFRTGGDAVAFAADHAPDVVVVDYQLEDMNGAEVCERIREAHPTVGLVVYTAHLDDDSVVARSVRAGADALLSKASGMAELLDAIRRVARGQSVIDPTAAGRVLAWARQRSSPLNDAGLSLRERDVLRLVAQGASTNQVASDLGISMHTVKTHITHILEKLQCSKRAEAVAIAQRRGLL